MMSMRCQSPNELRQVQKTNMAPKKVIIDTDVGLDDAVALLMLLKAHQQQLVEIVAITAVQGNARLDNVVRNIFVCLETMEMQNEIPVFKGASKSLVFPYDNSEQFHGWDGFGDVVFDNEPDMSPLQDEHAVNALTRLVQENPKKITLIVVGALTNIALAMRMDDEFAENVFEIFMMGGNTEGLGNITTSAEFNFYVDAEAAHIVLENVACPTYVITWELCLKRVPVEWNWRNQVLGILDSPQVKLLNKIEAKRLMVPVSTTWVVCDQLAVAAALERRIMTKASTYRASVELHGKHTRGQMVIDYANKAKLKPNVILVEQVNVEMVKSMIFQGMSNLAEIE